MKKRPWIRVPPSKTALNSARLRTRRALGSRSGCPFGDVGPAPGRVTDCCGCPKRCPSVPRAASEARRILRPGGWAALIWNDRQTTGSAFLAGYEALLRTHGIDYAMLIHRHVDEKAIAQFFAPVQAAVSLFDNPRELEREDLLALAGSASYLPAPGDPRHAAMSAALNALFDSHAKSGTVQMMYRTRMHYAQLN